MQYRLGLAHLSKAKEQYHVHLYVSDGMYNKLSRCYFTYAKLVDDISDEHLLYMFKLMFNAGLGYVQVKRIGTETYDRITYEN